MHTHFRVFKKRYPCFELNLEFLKKMELVLNFKTTNILITIARELNKNGGFRKN